MPMPELPHNVPTEQEQVNGARDTNDIYQTHRGKKPTSRDVGGYPPAAITPEGPLRYEEDT